MNRLYNIIFRLRDGVTSRLRGMDAAQNRLSAGVESLRRRFSSLGTSAADAFRRMRQNAADAATRVNSSMSSIGTTISRVFAAAAVLSFGNSLLQTALAADRLDRAIAFGSGANTAANMEFLNKTIDSLGLNAMAAKDGFATLAGSFKGTTLEGEPMRKLFTGMSQASAALGLSADDSKGAFMALGQIMSKGKVSAEELRGQLGERIPGAFQIAARAMGMTTQELDKQLQLGNVMAEDFLPKFADEMIKTFGADAQKNANSLTARFNRMQNAILDMKLQVFQLAEPLFTLFLKATTILASMLRPALDWVVSMFQRFGLVIAIATGFLLGYRIVVMTAALATKIWTGIQWLLNAALSANPIGIVIGLIAAIVAAIVYAYIKFDAFRGLLWGVWEAFKASFGAIGDLAAAVGEILVGAVTFDAAKVRSGMDRFSSTLRGAGQRIGDAFRQGYADGVEKKVQMPDFLKAAMGRIDADRAMALSGSEETEGGTGNTIAGVSGGGAKATTVNITIEKFQDQIVVNTTSMQEGEQELVTRLEEVLLRVVNGVNQVAFR